MHFYNEARCDDNRELNRCTYPLFHLIVMLSRPPKKLAGKLHALSDTVTIAGWVCEKSSLREAWVYFPCLMALNFENRLE